MREVRTLVSVVKSQNGPVFKLTSPNINSPQVQKQSCMEKFRHLTSTVEDTSRATDISAISDNFLTYNVTTAVFYSPDELTVLK